MFPCLSPLVDKPLLLNLNLVFYFLNRIGGTELSAFRKIVSKVILMVSKG